MAGPTSSGRERERERSSSSRHSSSGSGRISSTTLLLVLSLVLAVLAVLLSLPSRQQPTGIVDPSTGGFMSYLTPKRTRDLINRESAVALRESEVARREAELLGGSPAGLVVPTCAACPAALPAETSISVITLTAQPMETTIINPPAVTTTIVQVQEVTREVEMIPSGPDYRLEELLTREHRVSEREKDVGRREEHVGIRETDVARRENWIMEQLTNDDPIVEEEIVYENRPPRRRKELPIVTIAADPVTYYETVTSLSVTTETSALRVTVTVPEPAATRVAERPAPASASSRKPSKAQPTSHSILEEVVEEHVTAAAPPGRPQRKVIEVYDDDEEEEDGAIGADGIRTVTIKHSKRPSSSSPPPRQTAKRWFGGRFY